MRRIGSLRHFPRHRARRVAAEPHMGLGAPQQGRRHARARREAVAWFAQPWRSAEASQSLASRRLAGRMPESPGGRSFDAPCDRSQSIPATPNRSRSVVQTASRSGMNTTAVVPRPTALSIVSSPPCASMIRSTIARPNPFHRLPGVVHQVVEHVAKQVRVHGDFSVSASPVISNSRVPFEDVESIVRSRSSRVEDC